MISRRLELFEFLLRGPGSFVFRERSEAVPLELHLPSIGNAVLRSLGRFIFRTGGRNEPSKPIP